MGFSVRVNLKEKDEAVVAPQSIARNLMTYRNRVIVTHTGNYGNIAEVIMRGLKESQRLTPET